MVFFARAYKILPTREQHRKVCMGSVKLRRRAQGLGITGLLLRDSKPSYYNEETLVFTIYP